MSLITQLPGLFGRTLPVILQTEATECGLACLGMVSGYHGQRTDLATLRRRFSISQYGATLAQLIGIANALGLASRPLRLDLEDLPQLRTPCILHWNLNHFVVLKKATGRGIVIHDPATGQRQVSMDEVSRCFTGVALELWPSASFRPAAPPPSIRFRDLIGRVDGLLGAGTQVLVLAVALEVFALVSPFYLQWVIDHVLLSADRDLLTTLALGFGLLLISSSCSRPCAAGCCCTSAPTSACSGRPTCSPTCCGCRWRISSAATWATSCRASGRWTRSAASSPRPSSRPSSTA